MYIIKFLYLKYKQNKNKYLSTNSLMKKVIHNEESTM